METKETGTKGDSKLEKIKNYFKSLDKKDVAIMIIIPSILIPAYLAYRHCKKK